MGSNHVPARLSTQPDRGHSLVPPRSTSSLGLGTWFLCELGNRVEFLMWNQVIRVEFEDVPFIPCILLSALDAGHSYTTSYLW